MGSRYLAIDGCPGKMLPETLTWDLMEAEAHRILTLAGGRVPFVLFFRVQDAERAWLVYST